MPTISGGFSTKDPDAMKKVFEAVKASGGEVRMPFKATGFRSDKLNPFTDAVSVKAERKKEVPKKKIVPEKKTRRGRYARRGKYSSRA